MIHVGIRCKQLELKSVSTEKFIPGSSKSVNNELNLQLEKCMYLEISNANST